MIVIHNCCSLIKLYRYFPFLYTICATIVNIHMNYSYYIVFMGKRYGRNSGLECLQRCARLPAAVQEKIKKADRPAG